MTKIIEKIWNGDLEPIEFFGKTDPKIRKLERAMLRDLEALEQCLDEKQKEAYETYCDSVNHYISASSRQSFCDGFCIGMKLTAESFLDAEKLL